ncbi:MAG: AMP-binding protein [Campylobacteraceae bacterium]|nr:AMP-binding protein [Campylobacteraceae bacterium]
MKLEQNAQWKIEVPEYLNIGTACTTSHMGTNKENAIAMIIEDSISGTAQITYKELNQQSDKFANFLLSLKIDVRDRTLICLKNSLAYPISFFGSIKAGIIAVPTSTLLSGPEVKYLAEDSQAKAIVVSLSIYNTLLPYLENLDNLKHIIVVGCEDISTLQKPYAANLYSFEEVIENAHVTPNHYNSKSGEPAYLVYTSGTTGFPKGVLHSHRSLIGRTPASEFWFDYKNNDRIMHSGKFNWTYVLGSALMDPLYMGQTVIAYEGSNDAKSWVELIKKHKCTIFIGVPTIYRQILQKTSFTSKDCPSLRHCMSAGEHLSSEMVSLWQKRFKQDIYEAIGMSEFSYYISHSKYKKIRPGSAGFVQPGHNVKLLNPQTLKEVDVEEEGMICIGLDNPGLFLEYWNKEEETSEVKRNGYFFTGDYAKKDKEGYIWFLGRKDDIINTFGFRVSPHEIERVIKIHDKVDDCVALGLNVDANKTIPIIVILASKTLSQEEKKEILEYGQKNLAKYKAPREIYVLDEYPKTKNGKVLRKDLLKEIEKIGKKETQPLLAQNIYRPRRSMLFTPANNEKHIERSRVVLADAIIFNLEGILEDQKDLARDLLKKEFNKSSYFGDSERIIKINRLDSIFITKDLDLLAQLDIDGVLFSSIESADDVLKAEKIIQGISENLEFMIMIDTPLGVLNIQAICAASPKLKCIVIGTNRLAQKLQIDIKRSSKAMFHYMAQICLAARAYDKIIIDGPHYDVKNEFSCEASTKEAFYLGCDGKAVLHPIQLEYVNDIFTPKQEEIKKAKDLILAYEDGLKNGKEIIMIGRELIDKSRINWAQRTITLYERFKEIGQSSF